MAIEQVIRKAIKTRTPVSLCYESTGIASRIVHPQVLFRASTGAICLDGYQVDGATSSGERIPDWRRMRLAKITKIELLEGEFDKAPGLNLASSSYSGGLLAHV